MHGSYPVRKLHNYLQSAGVSLSKTKVYEYFSYLEDINFIFLLKKYGKGGEVEGSIPKIYLIDLGFVNERKVKKYCQRILGF